MGKKVSPTKQQQTLIHGDVYNIRAKSLHESKRLTEVRYSEVTAMKTIHQT